MIVDDDMPIEIDLALARDLDGPDPLVSGRRVVFSILLYGHDGGHDGEYAAKDADYDASELAGRERSELVSVLT